MHRDTAREKVVTTADTEGKVLYSENPEPSKVLRKRPRIQLYMLLVLSGFMHF